MALADFKPATEAIELPGGDTFAVRGLALEDFTVLARNHYDTMSGLWDRFIGEAAARSAVQATGGQIDLSDIKGLVLEVLNVAPGLLADVIARASDEPDMGPLIRKLPLGVQIEAIEKTLRLTLEAEGGMEKLVETLTTLGSSLAGLSGGTSP